MWMTLASGLQAVAAENVEDAANVAPDAAPDAIPGFDGKLPTPQQLLEMLDSMTGMSDEEKASLREDLLKNIQGEGYASQPAAGYDLTMQTMVLLSLLGLVALIFVERKWCDSLRFFRANGGRNMAQDILDSLRSHGVLSDGLQEKLSQIVPEDTKEKLSGFFQRYQELNDEEKEEVMNSVFGKLKESFQSKVESNPNLFMQLLYNNSYTVFFIALLLIVLVLVFFVYKLFKCLTERQTKREEKKKNRQLKKKK